MQFIIIYAKLRAQISRACISLIYTAAQKYTDTCFFNRCNLIKKDEAILYLIRWLLIRISD